MYDDGESFSTVPGSHSKTTFYIKKGAKSTWTVRFNGIIYDRTTTREEARRICLNRNH